METNNEFPTSLRTPFFASGHDQKQLIISDINKKNKWKGVPKPMRDTPCLNDINKGKQSVKKWILDKINRHIKNLAESSPSGKYKKRKRSINEKNYSKTQPKVAFVGLLLLCAKLFIFNSVRE